MNILATLYQQAAIRPDQPAIIDTFSNQPRITTFHQLKALVDRTSTLLEMTTLKPNDTVLVFQPMSLELYVILLALFKQQLVAVFLDPSAGLSHIARCCEIASPKALISSPKAQVLNFVVPALWRIPIKWCVNKGLWSRVENATASASECQADSDSPALLTFTSGSTGAPKAAMRTHGFLLAQHRVLESSLNLTPGAIDLPCLPIFVLANLASGMTSILPDANMSKPASAAPEPIVRQIEQFQPSTIGGSPAVLESIANLCLRNNTAMPSFNTVYTGGAPVFPKLMSSLQRVCPNAKIVAVYGSTEAEPIAHIALNEISNDDLTKMGSGGGLIAGRPVELVKMRVIRAIWGEPIGSSSQEEFTTRFCEVDEPGEIVVTGDHVLKSYWQGHGDSDTKFRVGDENWHRTGDCGYMDSDQRLWLLGRCSATISDSRGTIHPFAVECAIQNHPSISRTALIGKSGKRILVIEGREELTTSAKEEILTILSWAQIDEIRQIKSIPVDARHNSKIDYVKLNKIIT